MGELSPAENPWALGVQRLTPTAHGNPSPHLQPLNWWERGNHSPSPSAFGLEARQSKGPNAVLPKPRFLGLTPATLCSRVLALYPHQTSSSHVPGPAALSWAAGRPRSWVVRGGRPLANQPGPGAAPAEGQRPPGDTGAEGGKWEVWGPRRASVWDSSKVMPSSDLSCPGGPGAGVGPRWKGAPWEVSWISGSRLGSWVPLRARARGLAPSAWTRLYKGVRVVLEAREAA